MFLNAQKDDFFGGNATRDYLMYHVPSKSGPSGSGGRDTGGITLTKTEFSWEHQEQSFLRVPTFY